MWCFHALQCPQAFNSSSVEVSLRRTACSSFDSRDNNCGDPLWFRPSPVPAFSMDPMCGAVHPTSRCYIAAWQPCRADRVLVFGPCDNKPNTSKMVCLSALSKHVGCLMPNTGKPSRIACVSLRPLLGSQDPAAVNSCNGTTLPRVYQKKSEHNGNPVPWISGVAGTQLVDRRLGGVWI
jgi:hypothetical protein